MKATREAGLPIPAMLSLCEDDRYVCIVVSTPLVTSFASFLANPPSIIGTPFYLMSYVRGRVLKDPSLPNLNSQERRAVYSEMCKVLAAIHGVDVERAKLTDFGKHG